jgi:flagellar export protein FliJ
MSRDPLRALATLRRLAVDATRRELAKYENYQSALNGHVRACDQAIIDNEAIDRDTETQAASVAVVHSYIEKLNRRANLLRQHVPIAQLKTDTARSALSLARLAEKAIEEVTAKRDQARLREANRRAQHALDDMARRTPRERRHGL